MKTYRKPARVIDLRESGRVILAHGETTGHMHEVPAVVIDGERVPVADYFEEPETGRRVLLALTDRPFELRHQEHAPIALDPAHPAQFRQGDVFGMPIGAGAWEIRRQSEYSPSDIRQIAD